MINRSELKLPAPSNSKNLTLLPIPSLADFVNFVTERQAIKLRRESGQLWPWTDDPILRDYYFCNVHREDDKVTRWLADNWRAPHADDAELWFALTVFRRGFNNPSVGEELGYPVPWNPERYLAVYARRQAADEEFLRPAYMTPGPAGKSGGSLAELQVTYIFNPLWEQREYVAPRRGETLAAFCSRLGEQYCCGGFYAAQVVADLKYAQLKDASDWWTFVVSGPGSRRGLNRVLGRDKNAKWREPDWVKAFRELETAVAQSLPKRFHSQDLQNCLCEWDKRERIRLSEGNVRAYKPSSSGAVRPTATPSPSKRRNPDGPAYQSQLLGNAQEIENSGEPTTKTTRVTEKYVRLTNFANARGFEMAIDDWPPAADWLSEEELKAVIDRCDRQNPGGRLAYLSAAISNEATQKLSRTHRSYVSETEWQD